MDFTKFGRFELLYLSFRGLIEFYERNNNNLPDLNNKLSFAEVVEYTRKEYEKEKENKDNFWINNCEEFNPKVVEKMAKWSKSQIAPICSFLGGIASLEMIKFSGKFTPIFQWFWFDFFDTVCKLNENTDRELMNSRYDDDQVAITLLI